LNTGSLRKIVSNIANGIESDEFKNFVKNYLTYFSGLILIGAINFLSIPAIIRLYGTATYGEFSLIQNVILIAVSFASGWLNQCIIRFNDHTPSFVFSMHRLLIFSLLFTIGPLLVYHVYSGFELLVFFVSIVTLLFAGVFAVKNTFFQSEFKSRKSVIIDLIRVVTFVVLIFLFCFLSIPDSILLAFLCSYIVPVFYILLKSKLNFSNVSMQVKKAFTYSIPKYEIKKFVSYGIPLAFWFVASSLISVFSRYVMDHYLSISEVGYYSALYDMTNKGCQLLFTPFLTAGYPLICKLTNEGRQVKAFSVIRNLVLIELFLFVILSIGLFYLSDFYIERIIGLTIYSYSKKLVFLVLISSFLWQLAMLLHKPLEMHLRTSRMLMMVIVSLSVNVILSIILIPKYGIIAGAYATLASVIMYIGLTIVFVRWYRFKNKIKKF